MIDLRRLIAIIGATIGGSLFFLSLFALVATLDSLFN